MLLLVGQLAVGVGIGFANAPITSTAVSSLPLDRAAVAGGITSTARQVGAAAGVALAGGLVAEADQQQLSAATQTGYLLVTLCGLVLVLSAYLSRTRGR